MGGPLENLAKAEPYDRAGVMKPLSPKV